MPSESFSTSVDSNLWFLFIETKTPVLHEISSHHSVVNPLHSAIKAYPENKHSSHFLCRYPGLGAVFSLWVITQPLCFWIPRATGMTLTNFRPDRLTSLLQLFQCLSESFRAYKYKVRNHILVGWGLKKAREVYCILDIYFCHVFLPRWCSNILWLLYFYLEKLP